MKYKVKRFGFLARLGGNKKYHEGLSMYNKLPIIPEVKEDFPDRISDDFYKVLSFLLKENKSRGENFNTKKGCNAWSYSYDACLKQYKEGKAPMGVISNPSRIAFLRTSTNGMDLFVSWNLVNQCYEITEENASYSPFRFIGKSVKPVGTYKTFSEALRVIEKVGMNVVYC